MIYQIINKLNGLLSLSRLSLIPHSEEPTVSFRLLDMKRNSQKKTPFHKGTRSRDTILIRQQNISWRSHFLTAMPVLRQAPEVNFIFSLLSLLTVNDRHSLKDQKDYSFPSTLFKLFNWLSQYYKKSKNLSTTFWVCNPCIAPLMNFLHHCF